ncbi:MAG: hypothetical protein COA84_01710 [Robiginitomaculum sp.]|nr:MAG: hypothetical protein COA84_01710 [Robiginitomaculum sp.]
MAGQTKKKRPNTLKTSTPVPESKKRLMDAAEAKNIEATTSPARKLMARLAIEHANIHATDDDRWSSKRAINFIALSCTLAWFGIYWLVVRLF